MEPDQARRVELLVPMRTLVIVAAAIGLMAAFWAIGDTFLIVFVGIFLAFVFEYPVRLVMRKTKLVARARGDGHGARSCGRGRPALPRAARPARRRAPRLPPGPSLHRPGSARLGRAVLARRHRSGRERPGRRRDGLGVGPGRDLLAARDRGHLLRHLPRGLHDPLRLPLPLDRHREDEAVARERSDARAGGPLAPRLGARDRERVALGDRRRRHRDDRRHRPGDDRVAPGIELRARPRAHRRPARHDPQPRRDDRRLRPRSHPLGGGRAHGGADHAGGRPRLPAGREQRHHARRSRARRSSSPASSSSWPSRSSARCSACSAR